MSTAGACTGPEEAVGLLLLRLLVAADTRESPCRSHENAGRHMHAQAHGWLCTAMGVLSRIDVSATSLLN